MHLYSTVWNRLNSMEIIMNDKHTHYMGTFEIDLIVWKW